MKMKFIFKVVYLLPLLLKIEYVVHFVCVYMIASIHLLPGQTDSLDISQTEPQNHHLDESRWITCWHLAALAFAFLASPRFKLRSVAREMERTGAGNLQGSR